MKQRITRQGTVIRIWLLGYQGSHPEAASGMEEMLAAAMRSKDSPALKELVKKVAEMIATVKAMKQSVSGIQTTMMSP